MSLPVWRSTHRCSMGTADCPPDSLLDAATGKTERRLVKGCADDMRPIFLPHATARRQFQPMGILLVANVISYVGDVMAFLALPWFVLQTTGSLTKTGITAFCATAAIGLSALFGSRLVDRLGYKPASVLSDLVSTVSIGLVPLLYQMGMLSFDGLLVLVFLLGLVATPGRTARSALVPDLAQLADLRFERVTGLSDGVSRVAGFIGAPMAGLLIVLVGTSSLLWIDAGTFAVSALLIGLGVPGAARLRAAQAGAPSDAAVESPEPDAVAEPAPGARGGVREGLRFLFREPVLFSIVVTVLITNLLDAGFGSVLAPAYIKQVYGSAVVQGGAVAAFGGAAFVGALLFGAIGHRLPRRLTMGVGFSLAGPSRWFALAVTPAPTMLWIVSAVAGFCIGPVNPIISTISYERIPRPMRAQVLGAVTAGVTMGTPLGGLLAGYLGAALGIRTTLLMLGACYLAATLSLLVNPALRQMEAKPDTVSAS
jgi:MFS family permease